MHYIKTLSSTEMSRTGKFGKNELFLAKNAILFKKPTLFKKTRKYGFKKPKKTVGFLNGFFKWVKFN